jgi:hypothetical protein
MSHSAKQPTCPNCNFAFVPEVPDEFCPRCGQQNQAIDLHVGHVVEEMLEGVFHFDGKVFRTLRLLLFRPGELTRRFLAGHRMPYVPPVRLYIFISFLFFLALTMLSGHEPRHVGHGASHATASGEASYIRGQVTVNGKPIQMAELAQLPADPTPAQLDSMLRSKHEPVNAINRMALRRGARWVKASSEDWQHQILRATSGLLFLLMPLAALLLTFAYRHQKRPYLGNLIFTIHTHCFIFVLLLVAQLLSSVLPIGNYSAWLLVPVGPYFLLALRRMYGQSWGKTWLKSLLLGMSYTFTFAFAAVVVTMLGLALF